MRRRPLAAVAAAENILRMVSPRKKVSPFPRYVALLACSLVAAGPVLAQTLEEAEQAIRWKLDEEGRVCVWPDPYAGGATEDWRPIAEPRENSVWANMGTLGNLALMLCGDTDIVSISDAQRFWERLGVDEGELVRRLAEVPGADASATERMQFVLMIRALQDLGSKPAIGMLERVARAEGVDPSIRRAAVEAVADLRGAVRTVAGGAPGRRPLVEILADCPSGSTVLVVVDQTRLPPSRPMMALARKAGLAVTRKHIRMAGGTVSPATWAGAAQLAEGVGVLPYEIARRFGNHRITRAIASLRMPGVRQDPIGWVSFEGDFDLGALAEGLERELFAFAREGDELTIPLPQGAQVRVTPTRAILTTKGEQAPALGAERAAELAAELGDMPCTVRLHDLPIAEMGGASIELLIPERVGARVPHSLEEPLEVRARFASSDLAGGVERQIRGLLRSVEKMVDQGQLPESILDSVESVEMAVEEAELHLRVKLPAIDDAMLERLAQLGAG